jgi:hypothetical protein
MDPIVNNPDGPVAARCIRPVRAKPAMAGAWRRPKIGHSKRQLGEYCRCAMTLSTIALGFGAQICSLTTFLCFPPPAPL